jgi:hypothetical protein
LRIGSAIAGRGVRVAFASTQRKPAAAPRHHEVDFQSGVVAEVPQLSSFAAVHLGFEDLGGEQALEQLAAEGRLRQFGLGLDAEQVARQSGVADEDARALHQSLAEVLEVGMHDQDLPRGLEYVEPASDRRDAEAERRREP